MKGLKDLKIIEKKKNELVSEYKKYLDGLSSLSQMRDITLSSLLVNYIMFASAVNDFEHSLDKYTTKSERSKIMEDLYYELAKMESQYIIRIETKAYDNKMYR